MMQAILLVPYIVIAVMGGGTTFNTEKFLPECEELGVSYRPGNAFSESGKFGRYLRLTFTLYEEPDITEGVARLGAAYNRVT